LGHLSFSQIRKACRFQVICDLLDINILENTIRRPCQFGKQTRSHFIEKEGSSSKPLELVHIDLCGPSRKKSPRGEEYFILFIDDFSRMCWIGLKIVFIEVILTTGENISSKSTPFFVQPPSPQV